MSIRHGLLALLERQPMYGYQLRVEFEATTGGTWPLNVGQVYTTLSRLKRDALAEPAGADAEGRVCYGITAAGRTELMDWFEAPVERADRPRDELAIKLALAVSVPGLDVASVVQRQRTATLRHLQELTRLKRGSGEQPDLSWSLVLESLLFQAEAELRWLDHCEKALLRASRAAGTARSAQPGGHAPTPEGSAVVAGGAR